MKETYVISFEENDVCQGRLIKAENAEQAEAYFRATTPAATVYGVSIDTVGYADRGMPCKEVPDGWEEPKE